VLRYLATAAVLLGSASPLSAQGRYAASLGALWSSPLVTDQIFNTIKLQPSVAPALTLAASWPVSHKVRVGPELTFASGSLKAKESGSTDDAGTLRTFTAKVGAEGPATAGVWWRVDGGFVKYLPSEETGVFQQGGPFFWLIGAGADYRHRLKPGWQWFVGLRYDFHRFTTDQLQSLGFGGRQDVHRVLLSAGIAKAP
jgi:hypothetical protein